jgi:hypothetical protein
LKWLLRSAIALAALLVVAGIGLGIALPRIAGSAAVRARIESAARDALGRELRFEKLEAGILPPALRIVAPRIAGDSEKAPPLLEAKSISLRLALLPLLARTVAIDSLVVDGASLRLTRTKSGIELPMASPGGAAKPEKSRGGESGGSGSGVSVAVRGLSLRNSTLVLVDRSVEPAVTWELQNLRADASGHLLSEQVDVDGSAVLASGGKVKVEGDASLGGPVDLELELTKVALAPLAPYVKGVEKLGGVVNGSAKITGKPSDPDTASAVLDIHKLELARGALRAAGRVRVETELATPLRAPSGSFRADAETAEFSYGQSFHKAEGVPAEITGRVAPAAGGGAAIEDLKVVLRDATLRGRVARLSPLSVELSSDPVELRGSEVLFPGLASLAPTGRAQVESLAYSAQPQSLRGRVRLDGVEAHPANRPPLALKGMLVAEGQTVRLEQGEITSGGQNLGLDAALEDVFGAPRYRMAVEATKADANQVLTAFAGKPDTLFGLLGLQASFAGPLGGSLLQSLQGHAGFGVDDGRLAGVSLLRAVFERLGSAGDLALDLGRAFGGKELERFYSDRFETLRGTFDVAQGVARTDDLTLVYRGYGAVLRGTMGLADLALDTQGTLTFDEEVDALIGKELGIRNYTPARRTITLASVTGTLNSPKVRLSSRSVADLATTYAAPMYVDPLRKKAEKKLGKEGGDMVDQGVQILDGLLGGRRRDRAKQEPSAAPPAAETPEAPAPPAEGSASPNQ